MCSVVGCIGKALAKRYVLEGLARLEYRGYDSAGFACVNPSTQKIECVKAVGGVANLTASLFSSAIDGFVAIGHTRWATHGGRTVENAHPHFDCTKGISVVHNGIIENYQELKKHLISTDHLLSSQTDTEVLAHLFEDLFAQGVVGKDALAAVIKKLEGSYAFVVMSQYFPNQIFFASRKSPLCIGVSPDQTFIASDTLAFTEYTQSVIFVPDETYGIVTAESMLFWNFAGDAIEIPAQNIATGWSDTSIGAHEHFMLKEIYEQKNAIHVTVDHLQSLSKTIWQYVGISSQQAASLRVLKLLGCGTSWHAGRIAQFFFETITKIPANIHLASEFRYMPFFQEKESAYICISQSGETADTLSVLRLIKSNNLPIIALTNVANSVMAREADGFLLTQAGPEISVASTKAFSTQLVALYWFAHRLALEKGLINQEAMQQSVADVKEVACILERTIELYRDEIVRVHAPVYAHYSRAIFLGRHISYPFALEAALKMKEIDYIFAQCYPAGELKHGPLALVDAHTPIFVFSLLDSLLYSKLVSNVQEAKARGAHIVAFGFTGQDELAELADVWFEIEPCTPLLAPLAMTGIMQFFVYALANYLGRSIDRPRNLAKSLTVE